MNSNLKLFRPLFSYLFWNTNFCAMFPFCPVPLMWNVILYPTSTRMFYYHFNKIHIIIDNFHLKIEKKTKQKTKGSFILTPFCQHVHVLPMKPHHKINFFLLECRYQVQPRYIFFNKIIRSLSWRSESSSCWEYKQCKSWILYICIFKKSYADI